MTNSEILMICLTAVIAAAGVIGACIFNNQLSVMQGQLNEMKSAGKQTEILIETNRVLAEAAKKSADAAERTLTELERPYIFVDIPKFIPSPIKDRPSNVQYVLKNYGRTPAIVRWLKASAQAEPPSGNHPTWIEFFNGQTVFKPGDEMEIQPNVRSPFPYPTTPAIRDPKAPSTLLIIEITYSDVFDYMHVSEFTFFESGGSFCSVTSANAQTSTSPKVIATGPAPNILIDLIPRTLSGEVEWDSEPTLAVDLADPARMVVSAFTPDPNTNPVGRAPLFISEDCGHSWRVALVLPSEIQTSDVTVSGSAAPKRLFAGILKLPSESTTLDVLDDDDFTNVSSPVNERVSRIRVDQPYVQTRRVGDQERVYVGSNDLGLGPKSAVIDLSTDNGRTYKRIALEARATSGQNGPSVRPAASQSDDTVYVAYFGWRKFQNNIITADLVVARDDHGGTVAPTFNDLVDPSDGKRGKLVASSVIIPWLNKSALGCERLGSSLSLAVDPHDSKKVYIAWGDRVGSGDVYTVHIRKSEDKAVTWSGDLLTLTNTAPFSITVAQNGAVGILYQQYVWKGKGGRWQTHLMQSKDDFSSVKDTVLADVADNVPACDKLPYNGDYNSLTSVGTEFRGAFSASNVPALGDFPSIRPIFQRKVDFKYGLLLDEKNQKVSPSIDPFYFSVPAL